MERGMAWERRRRVIEQQGTRERGAEVIDKKGKEGCVRAREMDKLKEKAREGRSTAGRPGA